MTNLYHQTQTGTFKYLMYYLLINYCQISTAISKCPKKLNSIDSNGARCKVCWGTLMFATRWPTNIILKPKFAPNFCSLFRLKLDAFGQVSYSDPYIIIADTREFSHHCRQRRNWRFIRFMKIVLGIVGNGIFVWETSRLNDNIYFSSNNKFLR